MTISAQYAANILAAGRIGQIPWLRGAPASELVAVARHTTSSTAAPGQNLCREGEQSVDEAFIIVGGEAAVVVDGRPVARLTTGDICGEMALLGDAERGATVIALTPTTFLTFTRADLDDLIDVAPTFARHLMTSLAERLGHANRQPASRRRTSMAGASAR